MTENQVIPLESLRKFTIPKRKVQKGMEYYHLKEWIVAFSLQPTGICRKHEWAGNELGRINVLTAVHLHYRSCNA